MYLSKTQRLTMNSATMRENSMLSLSLFMGKSNECKEAVAPYFKWCPDLAAFHVYIREFLLRCINRGPFSFREIRNTWKSGCRPTYW